VSKKYGDGLTNGLGNPHLTPAMFQVIAQDNGHFSEDRVHASESENKFRHASESVAFHKVVAARGYRAP
jgi:hypothetical protein